MSHLIIKILIVAFFWLYGSSCRNLARGEIAKIGYESIGCFGPYKSEITIFEKGKNLYARLQSKEVSKTVRIGKVDLIKFQQIISRLQDLKTGGGCTSSIRYAVYTGTETFVTKDEGCQETGFEHFQTEIFDTQN